MEGVHADISEASDVNVCKNAVTADPLDEMIEDGAPGPPAQQKKNKKNKDKGKKSKGKKEDPEKRRKGQKNAALGLVEKVPPLYKDFLDDGDKATLGNITETLNGFDESTWDDATNVSFLRRIDLFQMKLKKRSDDNDKRCTKIVQLKTDLDLKAKESRDEAERKLDEAERKLAEVDKIDQLVSEFKTNLKRIEDQHFLVPIEDIKKKLAMGETLLGWLEEQLEQLDDESLASTIVAMNNDLLDSTFWDRSPSNVGKTTMGREPVEDFDSVKVERFIFNPLRTTFCSFIDCLRDRAADHPQFGFIKSKEGQFEKIIECKLLEHQTTAAKQPPRWFVLEMQHGNASADVYMRSDNLYIVGFGNKKKQVYELGNKTNRQLLKGSIIFGCDCDYRSLMNFERVEEPPMDQEVERLKDLNLSAMATAGDIEAMSEFDHTQEDSIDPEVWEQILERVQIAIARTAIVIPEVCRLVINCESINKGWLKWGIHLNGRLIGYMRNWKVMSDAIRNGPDDRPFTATQEEETGLTYAFQAFEVIRLVINSKGDGLPSKDNKKEDGPDDEDCKKGDEGDDENGKKGDSPDDEDGNGGESQGDNPPPDTKKEGNDDSQGGDGHDTGITDGGHDIEFHEFVLSVRERGHIPISDTGLLELLMPEKSIDVVRKGFLPRTTSRSKYESSGQRLVEVFSVHTNSSFIKKISIYDDRCGKIIYMSRDVDTANFFRKRDLWLSSHTGRDSLDYMDKLVISGPDRAMSAFPRFIIEVDVEDKDGVFNLCWNWAGGIIDKPMVQSIFTSRGDVHLTTAVMSNALQGSVEFSLFLPELFWCGVLDVVVVGELVLKIDNYPVGCSVFQSDSGDAYLTPTGKFTQIAERSLNMTPKKMYALLTKGPENTDMIMMKVPLTRDLLVLPVGCSINLTGDLRVGVATIVTINHSMKVNDQYHSMKINDESGWSKVPVDSFSMFGDDVAISHGAIRIETISPF